MAISHKWISTDGDMANTASWGDGTVPATAATGGLTFTGNALNTETVTLDVKVYTFQTVLTDVDGNVLIGATGPDSRDNLIAAIGLGAGAGTLYAASTTLHPTISAILSVGVLEATAKKKGTDGNSLASTETLTNGSWGAGTLLGGAQWASDDEIAVGIDTTQDFLTNLDWESKVSPELRLRRFNVDRTNINFGAPGNSIRLSLEAGGALNYLGTGRMYADFKGSLNVYVNSLTSQQVLNLNVRTSGPEFVFVESGSVTIVAGAVIAGGDDSQIYTTGPRASLVIQGVDEAGADILVAIAGQILNERRVLGSGWVLVLPDGRFTQRGIMGVSVTENIGVLNLGGLFSYQPVNDPTTNVLEGRFLLGVSRLDLSEHTLVVGDIIQGVDAELLRGPLIPVSAIDVDLKDDFPF